MNFIHGTRSILRHVVTVEKRYSSHFAKFLNRQATRANARQNITQFRHLHTFRSISSGNRKNVFVAVATSTAVFTGLGIVLYHQTSEAQNQASSSTGRTKNASELPDLPVYTADEVAQHNSKDKQIWVSYKNGVYDITNFVDEHPGGEIILLAAGSSLEPFWLLYQIHQKAEILEMLETFRIGNLSEDDQGIAVKDMSDPYATDPKRHPVLKPSSLKPFNAEPPLPLLAASYITPKYDFIC